MYIFLLPFTFAVLSDQVGDHDRLSRGGTKSTCFLCVNSYGHASQSSGHQLDRFKGVDCLESKVLTGVPYPYLRPHELLRLLFLHGIFGALDPALEFSNVEGSAPWADHFPEDLFRQA